MHCVSVYTVQPKYLNVLFKIIYLPPPMASVKGRRIFENPESLKIVSGLPFTVIISVHASNNELLFKLTFNFFFSIVICLSKGPCFCFKTFR